MSKNSQQTPAAEKGKAASAYQRAYYDALGEVYGLADLVAIVHPDPKYIAALTAGELNRMAGTLKDLHKKVIELARPFYEQARDMPDGFMSE